MQLSRRRYAMIVDQVLPSWGLKFRCGISRILSMISFTSRLIPQHTSISTSLHLHLTFKYCSQLVIFYTCTLLMKYWAHKAKQKNKYKNIEGINSQSTFTLFAKNLSTRQNNTLLLLQWLLFIWFWWVILLLFSLCK